MSRASRRRTISTACAGFDGVAPGAQLLGLKIALSAQGSVSTTGAMLRAMDYAIRFAESRRLPLVLNLSFGVGNEHRGPRAHRSHRGFGARSAIRRW